MIEIRIPKEINKYEAKFIGPFTMRQSVCLMIALPLCVLLYNLLSPYIPFDGVVFICIIPAGIAALFGWCKPYGMKFELFLRDMFITSFLAPSKRKYKTVNYYEVLAEQIREAEKEDAIAGEKKKRSKKKYRRSKEAIK